MLLGAHDLTIMRWSEPTVRTGSQTNLIPGHAEASAGAKSSEIGEDALTAAITFISQVIPVCFARTTTMNTKEL